MKLDNGQLKQKAKMVVYAIYLATQQFDKTINGKIKGVKPLKALVNISEDKKGIVTFLVMVSFLFHAQKYFWEKIISDEDDASNFEKYLYETFEQLTEVNPKPYIMDIGEYIKKQGREGEVMYLGNKVCKELNRQDAFLMLEINTIFSSLLNHGYFESLENAWGYKTVDEK